MRFSPSFLDDIRARLPVSAVVAKRIALKKSGREWRGLSPFAQEKTPSFFVNDQKGFYHCFSSGKHGDQFTFLIETEGLSFPEAVERLAGEAGLALPKPDPEAQKKEERAKSLIEICELAATYFEKQLRGEQGAQARSYLVQRELSLETQQEFRIGFAPAARHGLKEFLSAKNVPVADMIASGMLIGGDDIPVPYDRFRDRVMFPIQNTRGQAIAFGGRALSKDAQAKYLNSPETPLFHKGSQLYNIHRARVAAHTSDQLILVEGYTDVISLFQAGVKQAVAPLGTAFTEDQLKLVWRLADTPVFCFDGDKAGQKAADRAIDIALPHLSAGKSLGFAFLPAGLDPDDYIRKFGREEFERIVTSAEPLAGQLWERELNAKNPRTPEMRAAFEARLRDLLRSIADKDVRKYYGADFKAKLEALTGTQPEKSSKRFEGANPGSFQNRPRGGYDGRRDAFQTPRNIMPSSALRHSRLAVGGSGASTWPMTEAIILALAVRHPQLIEAHTEAFSQLDFKDPDLGQLRDTLLASVMEDGAAPENEQNELTQRLEAFVLSNAPQILDETRPESAIEDDFQRMLALRLRFAALNNELSEAQLAWDASQDEENWGRLQAVKQQLLDAEAEQHLPETV